ncbi:MAG: DNA-binding response regulator KdpE, partial [uncultured Thermomicrobiales bacterium]
DGGAGAGRRRRAADPPSAPDRAQRSRLRRGAGRGRFRGPRRAGAAAAGYRPTRSRHAARRWAGGRPANPRVVAGADHRPLGPGRGARQGRRAGPRRRRLPDEAVRDGGVAGPGPGGAAPDGRAGRVVGHRRRPDSRFWPPRRDAGRRRDPSDQDRVRPAPGAGDQRRQGPDPPAVAGACLGQLCRRQHPAAPGLRQLPAPQAGARPRPSPPDRNRARRRLPLPDDGV